MDTIITMLSLAGTQSEDSVPRTAIIFVAQATGLQVSQPASQPAAPLLIVSRPLHSLVFALPPEGGERASSGFDVAQGTDCLSICLAMRLL